MACPSQSLSVTDRRALSARLLDWFAAVRRELPWRQSSDLYGIWVSEVMLQQTTVKTVIPYWHRFMARFPTVADLAGADEADVLAHWSGLGYYSRARNLHRAARRVCDEGGGLLPTTHAGWLDLPGVGPYAAGAIASIGLGLAVPALDANARRVLLRWSVDDPEALQQMPPGARRRLVDALGAELVPNTEPGVWNEALMELGALVCRARAAACAECPASTHCRAQLGGWVDAVPPRSPGRPAVAAWVGLLVVTWRDRVLLMPSPASPLPGFESSRAVARNDFRGLHTGLWGLPMSPWLAGRAEAGLSPAAWRGVVALGPEYWPDRTAPQRLGEFRHAITDFRLQATVYRVALESRVELPGRWLGSADSRAARPTAGCFFRLDRGLPPLSALGDKALHFHQDSAV